MSLTQQQRLYAEARMTGLSVRESALAAGCPEKSASQAGSRLEKHPNVVAHLVRLKRIESETVPGSGADTPPPPAAFDDEYCEDPREFLKKAMNDRLLESKLKIQAAIALLPYDHAKLGETGKKEQKDQAAGEVVKGRFAPAPPPPAQMKLVR